MPIRAHAAPLRRGFPRAALAVREGLPSPLAGPRGLPRPDETPEREELPPASEAFAA